MSGIPACVCEHSRDEHDDLGCVYNPWEGCPCEVAVAYIPDTALRPGETAAPTSGEQGDRR